MLDYALCKELLAKDGLSLSEQAKLAQSLGYAEPELAPAAPHQSPDFTSFKEVAVSRDHPDIYTEISGCPELPIEDGWVAVGALNAPGFGHCRNQS